MQSKKKVTISSVGTSYVEGIISGVPDKFFITHVRADVKTGVATSVGLRISETSSPSVDEIVAEYAMAASIDESADLLVHASKVKERDPGRVFVAVKCNGGSNTVVVTVEYDSDVSATSGDGGGAGGGEVGIFTESEDGLVPAPVTSDGDFLRDDGVWATPAGSVGPDLTAIEALGSTGFPARTGTNTWALRTLAGTTNRITMTDGNGIAGEPVVDIAATYVGQTSITTLGTVATGTWNATTIGISKGGTGQTTATAAFDALAPTTTLGDTIYYNGTDNVRLAGNITTTKQFLTQTGNGAVSAAPAWGALVSGDIPSTLDANARVQVKLANVGVGTRRAINFIEGTGIALTITDQPGGERVDVEIENVAGLADGDYGDITVGSGGTVWSIDAGVVSTTELGGDITAFAKTFLDDADADTVRATLLAADRSEEYIFPGTPSPDYPNAYELVGGTGITITVDGVGHTVEIEATGGAGLVDGDYGDITVSGSGTVMNIDANAVGTTEIANDAVTYAKIQNVSATARLLGRVTGGAGDVEEIPVTAPLRFDSGALEINPSGNIDANARVAVSHNSGGTIAKRRRLNFIDGAGIAITVTDDSGDEEINVEIETTGGSGLTHPEIMSRISIGM